MWKPRAGTICNWAHYRPTSIWRAGSSQLCCTNSVPQRPRSVDIWLAGWQGQWLNESKRAVCCPPSPPRTFLSFLSSHWACSRTDVCSWLWFLGRVSQLGGYKKKISWETRYNKDTRPRPWTDSGPGYGPGVSFKLSQMLPVMSSHHGWEVTVIAQDRADN